MCKPSLLSQLLSQFASANVVRIRDPLNVEAKIDSLVTYGTGALEVISDFDDTFTKYHLNGKKCLDSTEIILNALHYTLTEEYKTKEKELREKYYEIEMDPTVSMEEKIALVAEWYELLCNALKGSDVTRESIKKMVQESKDVFMRDNTKTLFERLSKQNVPLLIISGGIGDVIEEILTKTGIDYGNVKIIANFMHFNNEGQIDGFKGPLIHMLNKNDPTLHDKGSEYFKTLSTKHCAMLLGDSILDTNMDGGFGNFKCVLKIGFQNTKVEEEIENFMDAYDIVLVDDQSMDFVHSLLDCIFSASEF